MRNHLTPNNFIIKETTCLIECYNNRCEVTGYAEIDLDDVERCKQHKWRILGKYVVTGRQPNQVFLHNFILSRKSDNLLPNDHKDRNGLNNTKDNLRIATKSQNAHNVGPCKTSSTGYRGVVYDKINKKYKVEFIHLGKRIHIGRYKQIRDAIIAYNEAVLERYGEFAYQNPVPLLRRTK
jgi:hypothetical protein